MNITILSSIFLFISCIGKKRKYWYICLHMMQLTTELRLKKDKVSNDNIRLSLPLMF